MVMQRRRRNKQGQARDILLALLKDQEAEAAKHKAAYEGADLRAASTRRAIELLDQAMLPGMEVTPVSPGNRLTLAEIGSLMAESQAEDAEKRVSPAPRIGEKAQGINDVWNTNEGPVIVHTALMYARQYLCKWCKAGVPFATEERTRHHVVTKEADGVERGFEYKPCAGVV